MQLVKKNIFKALQSGDIEYMIHCCNAQRTMGSGIAKTVRELYPEAFTQVLGSVTEASGIINLIGQRYYGSDRSVRYVSYDALAQGCEAINTKILKGRQSVVVGIPYLFASDRAGGNWEVVSSIMENHLNARVVAFKI